MAENAVCVTCGTQYAEAEAPPAECRICTDERQYVPPEGQRWTTLAELRREHRPELRELEPGLLGIGMEPSFAIGQRALLVQAPDGNVLWDCVALLDDEIGAAVEHRGGIAAIAISHPHYYTTMVEWGRAFEAPILVHEAEREWIMRPDERVELWAGETRALGEGLTLLRLGGHFPGGQVLRWNAGADGRGALLSGDILQCLPDRRFVSFMWSYPNLVPLPPAAVERMAAALEPYAFERIYGAWWDRVVPEDGKAAVRRSAERYVRAVTRGLGPA